jgi:hypothetical protein
MRLTPVDKIEFLVLVDNCTSLSFISAVRADMTFRHRMVGRSFAVTIAVTVTRVSHRFSTDAAPTFRFSALPPGFVHEVPQHLKRPPPNEPPKDPLTGLPILDFANYCCGAHGLSVLIVGTSLLLSSDICC